MGKIRMYYILSIIFILGLSARSVSEQAYPFGLQPTPVFPVPQFSPYSISTGMPLSGYQYGISTGMPAVPPGYPFPKYLYGIETSLLPGFGLETLLPPVTVSTATAVPLYEKSEIEKIYAGEFPTEISTEIQQFGYTTFQQTVSTFAPVLDVPVSEDYVIGPGDSFRITIWGRVNVTYPVAVDRNGEISVPEIGVLNVWGLTFGELKKYLNREIAKYYTDFEMTVTMDRIKTIRVYVVGEARFPGSYTVSALATLFNALYAAGGPSKQGTMRNIQLIRNGKVVQVVDLYDFLLKGDRTADVRLENQDTIFIPIIGKVAGIAGHVKRPAIYEFKETMNLSELIALAGGVSAVGYLERVQVERMEANRRRIVADFNLTGIETTAVKPELNLLLQDGDLVKIYPILPEKMNVVYLEGHVARPGEYELKPNMRLRDLIPSYDVLLPQPSLEYGQIIRLQEPDLHPVGIQFHLGKLLAGDATQNIELKRWDRVQIFPWSARLKKSVRVSGLVFQPGEYSLHEGMRVKDLITAAGGFTKNAYLRNAEITRRIITQDGMETQKLEVDLEEAMRDNPEHNIVLQDYDNLVVRPIPELEFDRYVTITGEVRFPGNYPVKKGERLSSLIERAGGYTEKAYLKGAVFTRESAQVEQRKRLNNLIREQEERLLSMSALAVSGALDKEEAAAQQRSLALQQQLLAKLRTVPIEGRMVVKLDTLEKLRGSENDIELEKNDALYIPETPGHVNIMGEVYNPTSVIYEPNRTVQYYLTKVGGMTRDADERQIYIIGADGTVHSREQKGFGRITWDKDQHRWIAGGFYNIKLDPGDTILVPRRLDRTEWVRNTKDITQILYQIAVSIGVLVKI
ncbi:MAG: SLBB domain-containing protein [bacterium]|nr:SLBB domain-containing protein [bacterium]